ncbi:hypothetical protein N7492_001618 [Penicillium capsulatum]|uniref:SIMPL domain-containing protein n=1 Tax=Penicillium capsulatum TaxID=69766 RepID=A0A9W9IU54_9EURO|nr:hypothetical protein N7492_001618 [Penicillium capsulatum]KAJ6129329.1 hypothetical protein N7512_002109 [Penicillium capsulatum]
MVPLQIHLSGTSSVAYRPERGTLAITVKSSGPEQQPVSADVTTTSNYLNQGFRELSPKLETGAVAPDAPVTSFSSKLLRTWSTRPTDEHNNPLPPTYHATIGFNVVFRDFDKLGEVAGMLASYPNVQIDCVSWDLTEATQKELGSETRKAAIRDAIVKANDYAEVVGIKVIPVEIHDRGQGTSGTSLFASMAAPAAPATPGGGLFGTSKADNDVIETTPIDLNPQDVRYSGSVDVRFEAVAE